MKKTEKKNHPRNAPSDPLAACVIAMRNQTTALLSLIGTYGFVRPLIDC
jgi:UPF0288 family protein (methanogenesis marker protein 3)